MKGESLEMETPGQTPDSVPTRKEWATWCRATCFSQKGRDNKILSFRVCVTSLCSKKKGILWLLK